MRATKHVAAAGLAKKSAIDIIILQATEIYRARQCPMVHLDFSARLRSFPAGGSALVGPNMGTL